MFPFERAIRNAHNLKRTSPASRMPGGAPTVRMPSISAYVPIYARAVSSAANRLEQLALLKARYVLAPGFAPTAQVLSISGQCAQCRSQFARISGQHVLSESTFGNYTRESAFGVGHADDRARVGQRHQEFAREKRVAGPALLRNQRDIGINQHGAIIIV